MAPIVAAIGAATAAIVRAIRIALRVRAEQRRKDAETAGKLRDELRAEVVRLAEAVEDFRGRAGDWEDYAEMMRRENETLREHAEERERRISLLEDKVQRLERETKGETMRSLIVIVSAALLLSACGTGSGVGAPSLEERIFGPSRIEARLYERLGSLRDFTEKDLIRATEITVAGRDKVGAACVKALLDNLPPEALAALTPIGGVSRLMYKRQLRLAADRLQSDAVMVPCGPVLMDTAETLIRLGQ